MCAVLGGICPTAGFIAIRGWKCVRFFFRGAEGTLCGGFLRGMESYGRACGAMPGQGLMGRG